LGRSGFSQARAPLAGRTAGPTIRSSTASRFPRWSQLRTTRLARNGHGLAASRSEE
ncbi:hypothetical protein RB213_010256, partial [Colletotrichum asianum]